MVLYVHASSAEHLDSTPFDYQCKHVCMYVHVSVYQKEITCRFRLLIFLKAYCHQFALNHLCRRQINTHCIIYKVVVLNFYTINTTCVCIYKHCGHVLIAASFCSSHFFPIYLCSNSKQRGSMSSERLHYPKHMTFIVTKIPGLTNQGTWYVV